MCKKMSWENSWENDFIPFSAEAAPSNSMEGRSGEKCWDSYFYTFLGGAVTDFLPIQWKDAPGKNAGQPYADGYKTAGGSLRMTARMKLSMRT